MKKILLVTNIPSPYRIPLFNLLSRKFAEKNFVFHCVFAAASYKRRFFKSDANNFQFNYSILNSVSVNPGNDPEKTYFLYKGLWKELKRINPDIVIVSGFSAATMKVLLWKFLKGTPYIIWSGSVEKSNRNDSFLRKTQRTLLLKFASSFIVYGTKAKEYLVNHGADPSKINIAINTVDTVFYAGETEISKKNNSPSSITIFTYTGYLVPRKNVIVLLKAIQLLSQKRQDFKLEIIGDGSSKSELEKFVANNHLENLVSFEGFRQKEELPVYFARSNGFLFQTDFDIWGLVLNEAMAAGIPCLASINAGATYDLIEDGRTGFKIDYNDIQQVTEKLNSFIDQKEDMKKIGQRGAEFIRINANLEISAQGFLNAVEIIKTKTN